VYEIKSIRRLINNKQVRGYEIPWNPYIPSVWDIPTNTNPVPTLSTLR
jgi:hypothetical protein